MRRLGVGMLGFRRSHSDNPREACGSRSVEREASSRPSSQHIYFGVWGLGFKMIPIFGVCRPHSHYLPSTLCMMVASTCAANILRYHRVAQFISDEERHGLGLGFRHRCSACVLKSEVEHASCQDPIQIGILASSNDQVNFSSCWLGP